jgi:hypothetical protein
MLIYFVGVSVCLPVYYLFSLLVSCLVGLLVSLLVRQSQS